jgi:hypothetical protein
MSSEKNIEKQYCLKPQGHGNISLAVGFNQPNFNIFYTTFSRIFAALLLLRTKLQPFLNEAITF